MANYQQGDANAAGLLVDSLSPQFFRFFLGQVRNRELADDLLQDFWLRIHSARHLPARRAVAALDVRDCPPRAHRSISAEPQSLGQGNAGGAVARRARAGIGRSR